MTCIAIANTKKGLIMAGDRRCSGGMSNSYTFPEMKIKKMHEKCLMGAAGDGALCQLIIGHFNSKAMCPLQWIHELRTFLVENHYCNSDNRLHIPKDSIVIVLLVLGDKVVEVTVHNDEDTTTLGYDPVPVPYAIGCGGSYAHAVLLSRIKNGVNTKDDMRMAMKVTAELSPGVDSNVDIIEEGK